MIYNDLYWYRAEVLRVVDGDTIDLNVDLGFRNFTRQRFRFAGVDTWETRGEHREKGKAATAFVESYLPEGSWIEIRTAKDKTGKYGRYLLEEIRVGDEELISLLRGSEHEKTD